MFTWEAQILLGWKKLVRDLFLAACEPVRMKSESEIHSVVSDSMQSMESSRPEYWSGEPFLSPGDLPNPVTETRSLTLQADSLPAEPQGKPKNTGMGSLCLLQGIFPTQELNRGLLHCR